LIPVGGQPFPRSAPCTAAQSYSIAAIPKMVNSKLIVDFRKKYSTAAVATTPAITPMVRFPTHPEPLTAISSNTA